MSHTISCFRHIFGCLTSFVVTDETFCSIFFVWWSLASQIVWRSDEFYIFQSVEYCSGILITIGEGYNSRLISLNRSHSAKPYCVCVHIHASEVIEIHLSSIRFQLFIDFVFHFFSKSKRQTYTCYICFEIAFICQILNSETSGDIEFIFFFIIINIILFYFSVVANTICHNIISIDGCCWHIFIFYVDECIFARICWQAFTICNVAFIDVYHESLLLSFVGSWRIACRIKFVVIVHSVDCLCIQVISEHIAICIDSIFNIVEWLFFIANINIVFTVRSFGETVVCDSLMVHCNCSLCWNHIVDISWVYIKQSFVAIQVDMMVVTLQSVTCRPLFVGEVVVGDLDIAF